MNILTDLSLLLDPHSKFGIKWIIVEIFVIVFCYIFLKFSGLAPIIWKFIIRIIDQIKRLIKGKKWMPYLFLMIIGLAFLLLNFSLQKPYPKVLDEYGHLLIADNLVNGKIASPTHSEYEFFESIFVLHQPSFTGKYPPGQGMLLAIGIKLFGHPIAGVWITYLLAAFATYWFLRYFMTQGWSLFGALLIFFHGKLLADWGMTYWGGSPAMLGSALFFGSLFRIKDSITFKNAILMAVGIILMFYNRPYESALTLLPALGFLIVFIFNYIKNNRIKEVLKNLIIKLIVPVGVLMIAMLAFIFYYNQQITVEPLNFPHAEYSRQYEIVRPFVFQHVNEPPNYSYPEIAQYNERDYENHVKTRYGIRGYLYGFMVKIIYYWSYFFGLLFSIPLIFYFKDKIKKYEGFILFTIGFVFLGSTLVTYEWSHYFSVITPLFILLIMRGFISFEGWVSKSRNLLYLFLSVLVLILLQPVFGSISHIDSNKRSFAAHRERMKAKLKNTEGKHLVFVKYEPGHNVVYEWVYNDTNIDDSKIVWARYLGDDKNKELLDYYNNSRQVWKVFPDRIPPVIQPY